MPPEPKMDDQENLEQLPPEPRAERLAVQFLQQETRRRRRRYNQYLGPVPRALTLDFSPDQPLPPPESYPDLQQMANAADPSRQGMNAPYIKNQMVNAADPSRQGANAPYIRNEMANAADPSRQRSNAPYIRNQMANAADPGEQVASVPALSAKWSQRCISFYKFINSPAFQFPFHTLLLTWPISTAILGSLNLRGCSINYYLPFVMMAVGLLGTATVVFRLYVIFFEYRLPPYLAEFFWISVRAAEFLIWVFFSIQLFLFFKQDPSFTPGDKHYCKRKYYKINSGLMFMTSAVMIRWFAVNVGKLIYWFSKINEHSRV